MEKLIVLSGKARSGKDTVTRILIDYYKNKKSITVSFAYYLKDYLRRMGLYQEENKPRRLMQEFGLHLKEKMGSKFFINRLLEDIKVLEEYYDVIIVTDARLKEEMISLKEKYPQMKSMRIVRENYDNGLSETEKNDITEMDLDDFSFFDYVVYNNNTLEEQIRRYCDE